MPWLDGYDTQERRERRVIEISAWLFAALAFALVVWLAYSMVAG